MQRDDVAIQRDEWGVPHVTARSNDAAWFGLGYVSAEDRLWQMEADRRRGSGRWADIVGPVGLASDRLARRLRLAQAAVEDVAHMSRATQRTFAAYADGVNARIAEGDFPAEFVRTGVEPEPWKPWHSAVAFKFRHVLMGTWQLKLTEAKLLALIGPEAYAQLEVAPETDSENIIGPREGMESLASLAEKGLEDLRQAAAEFGFLAGSSSGSNSWAIHGSRTANGRPIMCNDSHRFLEMPNVYWQAELTAPDFHVAGATFPGLPGFPHFGDNGSVAWSITHGMGDYQDLYVEEFDPADPTRYRVGDGWAEAELSTETIGVRGAPAEQVGIWATRNGPIVHGNPSEGLALALRYSGTDGPCRSYECLAPMLAARTVEQLFETQRGWVDPVNNFVAVDADGHIGYLTRGVLPVRRTPSHRRLPVPGWTGEGDWIGEVPFEKLPRVIDPPEGFIATANQRTQAGDDPYVGAVFVEPYRAERIRELLSSAESIDLQAAAAIQADVTSTAARRWVKFLAAQEELDGDAETGRKMLAGWDAILGADSPKGVLYGCFRRFVCEELLRPVLGERAWTSLTSEQLPSHDLLMSRWLGRLVRSLDGGVEPPDGSQWSDVLQRALSRAWTEAVRLAGPDPEKWRWQDVHFVLPRHALSGTEASPTTDLDGPRIGLGGDGDVIRCADYSLGARGEFEVSMTSVYRQVLQPGDSASASWVVPGGVSAVPGSDHRGDQLDIWARAQRIRMYPFQANAYTAPSRD